MLYRYSINEGVPGMALRVEVEADGYKLEDDHFNFYQGFGTSREKVETIRAGYVARVIRRETEAS